MTDAVTYDAAIVGGGLAGLALAIQLRRQGHSVILFEKEQYPFHKVCGEYISLESWDFLKRIGVDPGALQVPVIKQLLISSPGGAVLQHALPLGGFGISRYVLDDMLAGIAAAAGVVVRQHTKVSDICFGDDGFTIHCNAQQYRAKVAAACYGKRSNMDIKWKRPFTTAAKSKINNYIGVKYHVTTSFAADTIALHNFKNGYAGLVKIEGDLYNLCYLTRADNLQQAGGDIRVMEQTILSQNPHLKKIFSESEIVFEAPLTISQISFDKKTQVEDHVLMTGDAAGMITPLCGNGMSMALHGSKIAAGCIHDFLTGASSRSQMESDYTAAWRKQFARRLAAGRFIQRLLGNRLIAAVVVRLLRPFPRLVKLVVQQTHGRPF